MKISSILLALTLLSTGALAEERQRAKVLVVNVPDVNHADSGNAGVTAIRELAVADRYDVDVCVDYGLFTGSYLAPYDAMVWVMAAPLTWTDSSKTAFEEYVRLGKGFIGLMYAGFGHEPAIYNDPNVRTLLRNAILWAAEKPATMPGRQ